ncbi:Aminopeptidase N-14, partial [Operophtera brumata]
MVALSNTLLEKTEEIKDEPNAVRDHFERTPPMSTFTLGLYLESFEDLNNKLDTVFRKLESIWQVSLPLKKLDLVALPTYTGVKPSDNWGLIIFKESDLNNKGYLQLAQEISYQWLGAFTTPAWWSDAHLNKALVGYIAAETAFQINHGSEMEGKWPLTVLYSLYYEFSKRYPHSRITGMKQETTCTKLELLFRMFNYTIGGNTFKKAIKGFLESRKFKTFTGDDIWSALSAAAVEDKTMPADVDTKTVAKSWIDKDRLPVVNIERNYERNYLVATQKVYLRERPHDVPDAENMSWWVPLVIIKEDNLDFTQTTPEVWTKEKELKIRNMPGKEQFIIVNPEEIAPFPVNYDTHNWYLISQYLQSSKRTSIPELTRAKLQHDAWNLAFAGELSFATALNMTLFLKEERSHLVWDSVFTMIDHKEEKEDEMSWKTNLRTLTKNFLCQSGYKPCIKEAQEQYA